MKVLTVLFSLLVAAPVFGAGLADSKAAHAASSEKIHQAYTNAVEKASAGYLQYLGGLRDSLKSKGQLQQVLGVQKEIERFEKERTPLPRAETPRILSPARSRLANLLNGAERTRNEHIAELLARHVKQLQQLQKALVQQEEIAAAVEVKGEVTAATQALADVQKAEQERRRRIAETKVTRPRSPGPFNRSLPAGLRRGLIGYYSFDRKEPSAIRDKSGERNDGKPNEVEWTAKGKRGGGLEVDFSARNVELPQDILQGLTAFTMAVWVKVPEYSGGGYPSFIGSQTDSPGTNHGIGITPNTGRMWLEVDTVNRNVPGVGKLAIPWDTWFHAAAVYDGETFTEYLNGEPGFTAAASGKLKPAQGVYLGSHGPGYNPKKPYIGVMDEVMIYNRGLSKTEMEQLYQFGK